MLPGQTLYRYGISGCQRRHFFNARRIIVDPQKTAFIKKSDAGCLLDVAIALDRSPGQSAPKNICVEHPRDAPLIVVACFRNGRIRVGLRLRRAN